MKWRLHRPSQMDELQECQTGMWTPRPLSPPIFSPSSSPFMFFSVSCELCSAFEAQWSHWQTDIAHLLKFNTPLEKRLQTLLQSLSCLPSQLLKEKENLLPYFLVSLKIFLFSLHVAMVLIRSLTTFKTSKWLKRLSYFFSTCGKVDEICCFLNNYWMLPNA